MIEQLTQYRADYPTEAADGTPHLSYFKDEVPFVWSGSAERPIQVCPGAAGEAVQATIDPTEAPAFEGAERMTGQQMLRAFQLTCDRWLYDAAHAD